MKTWPVGVYDTWLGIQPPVSAQSSSDTPPEPENGPDVAGLIPLLRRLVGARVADHAVAEDLVQETLARVLSAASRIEPGMLEPYAIVTARNLIASLWQEKDRHRRNEHRVVDLRPRPGPRRGPVGPRGT